MHYKSEWGRDRKLSTCLVTRQLLIVSGMSRMVTDPLVHHGCHFGRVVHAFCNLNVLVTNGLMRMSKPEQPLPETLSARWALSHISQIWLIRLTRERREHFVFQELLKICPGLQERLVDSSEEEVKILAGLILIYFRVHGPPYTDIIWQIQKGMNGARSDDTKGMKSTVIDWITLNPALNRKIKSNWGFHNKWMGALLTPAGLDWSVPQWVNSSSIGDVR